MLNNRFQYADRVRMQQMKLIINFSATDEIPVIWISKYQYKARTGNNTVNNISRLLFVKRIT